MTQTKCKHGIIPATCATCRARHGRSGLPQQRRRLPSHPEERDVRVSERSEHSSGNGIRMPIGGNAPIRRFDAEEKDVGVTPTVLDAEEPEYDPDFDPGLDPDLALDLGDDGEDEPEGGGDGADDDGEAPDDETVVEPGQTVGASPQVVVSPIAHDERVDPVAEQNGAVALAGSAATATLAVEDIERALWAIRNQVPPPLTGEELVLKRTLGAISDDMILEIPPDRIRRFAQQPRKYFDPEKILGLARSIERAGQRRPGEVVWLPENDRYFCELVTGERRLTACVALGRPFRATKVQVPDRQTQFVLAVIENCTSAAHTPLELALAIDEMYRNGWRYAEIGEMMNGKTAVWAMRYRRLVSLAPQLQELMSPSLPENRRLALSVAMSLATLPHDLQIKLLGEVTERKLKVIEALHYIRRRALEEGAVAGDPRRSPNKDFAVLVNSIRVMQQRAGVILAMGQPGLKAAFDTRNPDVVAGSLNEIDALASHLTNIRKLLEGVTLQDSSLK